LEGTFSEAMQDWLALDNQMADLRERAKELKIPLAELAILEAALTEQYRKAARARAEDLAGTSTSFTGQLSEGTDYFTGLRYLGEEKTGMPPWLVDLLSGKFLDKMGRELQSRINTFNGLADPLAEIGATAEELRIDLAAFAEAAGWSAERIAAAEAAIAAGARYQTRIAELDVLDRVFANLAGLPEWEDEIRALALARFDIEYAILKQQMIALGIWEANAAAFNAAYGIARDLILTGPPRPDPEDDRAAQRRERANIIAERRAQQQEDRDRVIEDMGKTFMDILKGLRAFHQSLMLDDTLSPLSPAEMALEAQRQYRDLTARAESGDVDAIRAREAAGRDYIRFFGETWASSAEGQVAYAEVQRDNLRLMGEIGEIRQDATIEELRRLNLIFSDAQEQAHRDMMTLIDVVWLQPLNAYAKGGIVTHSQVASVGEEGPEAVIPLAGGKVPVKLSGGSFGGGGSAAEISALVEIMARNTEEARKREERRDAMDAKRDAKLDKLIGRMDLVAAKVGDK
jgi:hypothetical protein